VAINVEGTVIDTHPPLAPRALIHIGPDEFLEWRSMNAYQASSAMMTRRHRPEAKLGRSLLAGVQVYIDTGVELSTHAKT
jgi:hypothetical protein